MRLLTHLSPRCNGGFLKQIAQRWQNLFLMMVASSMYTLARTGRVETLDEPAFSSDDLYLLGPRTKEFIVNGMAAVLVPQL